MDPIKVTRPRINCFLTKPLLALILFPWGLSSVNAQAPVNANLPVVSRTDFQSAIENLILGDMAANRGDALKTAHYFESLTRVIPQHEGFLMQCFNGALQSQQRKIADLCYERIARRLQEKINDYSTTPSSQSPESASSSEQELEAFAKSHPFANHSPILPSARNNLLDQSIILAARKIALTYPLSEAPALFIEKIQVLDIDQQRAIIGQLARLLNELRQYDRGVHMFLAITQKYPEANFKIFYAEFLRQTWQDEKALAVSKSAFDQEKSPLSILAYAEALQQNNRIEQAFSLLSEYQNAPQWADLILRTRIEKIKNVQPESSFRMFLESIEHAPFFKELQPNTLAFILSQWFDLKEYNRVLDLASRLQPNIVTPDQPDINALFLYLKGASLLLVGKSDGQALIDRVGKSPRFTQMEKSRYWRQKIVSQGLNATIDELMQMEKIIRAPSDYSIAARVLNEFHRDEDALAVLKHGLAFHDNDPAMLYEASMAAIKLDRLEDLEKWLLKAIAINPQDYQAHNALGYSWVDKNINLTKAKTHLDIAISYQPLEPVIMDSVGWYYYRAGKTEKALSILRRAHALQRDPEIAAHLIEVLWKLAHSVADPIQAKSLRDEARSLYTGSIELVNGRTDQNSMRHAIQILKGTAELLGLATPPQKVNIPATSP